MKIVVKVQRPLAQSGGEPIWLIYDEEREHMFQIQQNAIPKEVRDIMGNRPKAFFRAILETVQTKGYRSITLLPEEVVGETW